jgi:hypothetical protein
MRALLLAVLAVALAGCGGGASDQQLSTKEKSKAASAESALSSYCRKGRLFLLGKRGPLSASDFQLVNSRLNELFSLARQKPDALYQEEETLRELLGNMAEELEATNCSPNLEQELNRAFNSLPPQ